MKYYDLLVKLQQEAQNEGRGLWSEEKEREKSDNIPLLGPFVGNTVSKVYHYYSCTLVKSIKDQDKIFFFSPMTALSNGYTACNVCKTPEKIGGEESKGGTTTPEYNTSGRWPEGVKGK
jgi:micrococcal nuclease